MKKNRIGMTPKELDFSIADQFFRQKKKPAEIAINLGITREAIYPAIQRLRDRHAIHYLPPLDRTTKETLAKRYRLSEDSLTVVDLNLDPGREYFAAVVAELALRRIKQVGQSRADGVGVGLGPGGATRDVARVLGNLMKSDADTPQLRLVTISSACPATCPEVSPTAFLNFFPHSVVKQRIGLFAEPIVSADAFAELRTRPGVREAFQAKPDIDVVISAMGNAADEHDLLQMLMREFGEDVQALEKQRWVGNVMYRPYNAKGPIHEQGREQRAVTLFELEDFVQMSKTRNKHVILIARSCGGCPKSKAASLRPLLERPELRLWSDLIMDVKTASELTGSPAPK